MILLLGNANLFPFSPAANRKEPIEAACPKHKVETGDFKSRIIMDPVLSPNGRKIAFSTLLHLYIANVDDGSYQRLTKSKLGEFHPSWSKDGRYLTYVTWESDGGHIWQVNANGKRIPKKAYENIGILFGPCIFAGWEKNYCIKRFSHRPFENT